MCIFSKSFFQSRKNFQDKFKHRRGIRDDLDLYVKENRNLDFRRNQNKLRTSGHDRDRIGSWGVDEMPRRSPRQQNRKAFGNDFSSNVDHSSGGGGVMLFFICPVFFYFIYKVAS